MKLWDIVRGLGGAVISTAFPVAGPAIVGTVNALLPKDKQLPEDATGDTVTEAIRGLPPEQQSSVMEKQFDVEITKVQETNETLRTMLKSEQGTRPKIAYQAFQIVAFNSVLIVGMWAIATVKGDVDMVASITSGWAFVGAVNAPFILWLNGYFGILRDELKSKLDAARGVSSSPVQGIFKTIASAIKKGK